MKTKYFGRVRTQVLLSSDNWCEIKEEVRSKTVVVVKDEKCNGDGNGDAFGRSSTVRRVRRGRKTSINSGGTRRKRRRRLSVSIDKFKLFRTNGNQLQDGSRRGLGKGWDAGMTDEDKFRKSIRASEWCTVSLQEAWKNVSFLRCSGGMRRDQKFICIGTVRMKRLMVDGGSELVVMLSVLVEEEFRKLRALTVRAEKRIDGNGSVVVERTAYICCCHQPNCI